MVSGELWLTKRSTRRQKVIGMVYRIQIGKVLTQLPHEETTR